MKPLTNEELQALDGILPEDKELIERIAKEAVREDANDIRVMAIRGYLAGRFLEMAVNDVASTIRLRSEIDKDAASFDDGWTAALEHAGKG